MNGLQKRIAYPGWPEVPALASGGWIEKNVLRVRCALLCHWECALRL